MRLLKKVAGAIKDRNSIWVSSVSQKTSYRNPDLEATVIKATSHDESSVDFKNFQRVYLWLRTSPLHLKPLIWSLAMRMEKTRCWVVALKGLMLMHGVFCCNLPNAPLIGRLPFDLSNFSDGHSKPSKTWAFNAFIRAYFGYLDHKSTFISSQMKRIKNCEDVKDNVRADNDEEEDEDEELKRVMQMQTFLDMLLQIKPEDCHNMFKVKVIREAMICIITEIFEVYSEVCQGIERGLVRIQSSKNRGDAEAALGVLNRAKLQSQKLSLYFQFCNQFGVIKDHDCPEIVEIRDQHVEELEKIIKDRGKYCKELVALEEEKNCESILDEVKEVVVVLRSNFGQNRVMTTIITDQWEVFDEDLRIDHHRRHHQDLVSVNDYSNINNNYINNNAAAINKNPFAAASCVPQNTEVHHFPDLITF